MFIAFQCHCFVDNRMAMQHTHACRTLPGSLGSVLGIRRGSSSSGSVGQLEDQLAASESNCVMNLAGERASTCLTSHMPCVELVCSLNQCLEVLGLELKESLTGRNGHELAVESDCAIDLCGVGSTGIGR